MAIKQNTSYGIISHHLRFNRIPASQFQSFEKHVKSQNPREFKHRRYTQDTKPGEGKKKLYTARGRNHGADRGARGEKKRKGKRISVKPGGQRTRGPLLHGPRALFGRTRPNSLSLSLYPAQSGRNRYKRLALYSLIFFFLLTLCFFFF